MKTPLGSFILGIPLYWDFNLHKKNQVWEGRQEWNDPHIGIVVIKPKELFRLLINFANIYLCHLHRLNQGPSVQIYRFLQLNMAIYMGFGGFFFFFNCFFFWNTTAVRPDKPLSPPSQAQRQRAGRSFTCTLLGLNPETPYWGSQAPAGLYQWAITRGVGFWGFSPWSETQVWRLILCCRLSMTRLKERGQRANSRKQPYTSPVLTAFTTIVT
jgi:hypothetical protein